MNSFSSVNSDGRHSSSSNGFSKIIENSDMLSNIVKHLGPKEAGLGLSLANKPLSCSLPLVECRARNALKSQAERAKTLGHVMHVVHAMNKPLKYLVSETSGEALDGKELMQTRFKNDVLSVGLSRLPLPEENDKSDETSNPYVKCVRQANMMMTKIFFDIRLVDSQQTVQHNDSRSGYKNIFIKARSDGLYNLDVNNALLDKVLSRMMLNNIVKGFAFNYFDFEKDINLLEELKNSSQEIDFIHGYKGKLASRCDKAAFCFDLRKRSDRVDPSGKDFFADLLENDDIIFDYKEGLIEHFINRLNQNCDQHLTYAKNLISKGELNFDEATKDFHPRYIQILRNIFRKEIDQAREVNMAHIRKADPEQESRSPKCDDPVQGRLPKSFRAQISGWVKSGKR